MNFRLLSLLSLPLLTTQQKLPKNYNTNLELAQDILDELFLTSQNTKIEDTTRPASKEDKPKVDLQTGSESQQTLFTSKNIDPNLHYNGDTLINWINENGGYIHPNARIGLDPTGKYRGVFVKTLEEGGTEGGIEDDEVICRIPW
jgi:hypothetical protein